MAEANRRAGAGRLAIPGADALQDTCLGFDKGLEILAKVTSNNAESMNAKFSTKRSYDAIRGKNWLDVVPRMLQDTRQHFTRAKLAIDDPKSVVSLLDGLTNPGIDIVVHNCTVGAGMYKYMDESNHTGSPHVCTALAARIQSPAPALPCLYPPSKSA